MTTFIPEPHLLDSPRHRPWPAGPAGAAPPALSAPPAEADVVIVGAGPAGLATASALWHRGVRDVLLVDTAGRPCGRFFDRIDMLRQRVLRSPYEHHPGVEGYRDCELLDFARLHWSLLTTVERREIRMAQAGHRSVVPVDVFEAYCRHVAFTHQVTGRTWQAAVRELWPGPDAVRVRAGAFEVTARYVVLCTGEERRPAPPGWWEGSAPPDGVTYWDEPVPGGAGQIVVVGAGLTAAHLLANALSKGGRAAWVFRAAQERYQCSDVNSAFFRPEGRARFDGVTWDDRRRLMREQRRASVMFEFRPLLRRAEADGRLTVHRGHAVAGVASRAGGGAVVRLTGGREVAGDHVVLALGTAPSAGGPLLPEKLTGSRDGWPDLDERTLAYRRTPRVFAVGAAAGMALGPAARNIDGHRVATARVAAAVAGGLWQAGRPRRPPVAPAPGRPPASGARPHSPHAQPPHPAQPPRVVPVPRPEPSHAATPPRPARPAPGEVRRGGFDTRFSLPAVDGPPSTEAGVILMGLDAERLLAGLGAAADGDDPAAVTLLVDQVRHGDAGADAIGALAAAGMRRWRSARVALATGGQGEPPAGSLRQAWAQALRRLSASHPGEGGSASRVYLTACWLRRADIDSYAAGRAEHGEGTVDVVPEITAG